jgi:hypothetical protein
MPEPTDVELERFARRAIVDVLVAGDAPFSNGIEVVRRARRVRRHFIYDAELGCAGRE